MGSSQDVRGAAAAGDEIVITDSQPEVMAPLTVSSQSSIACAAEPDSSEAAAIQEGGKVQAAGSQLTPPTDIRAWLCRGTKTASYQPQPPAEKDTVVAAVNGKRATTMTAPP